MIKEIITHSEQETLEWAEKIGANAQKGAIYALYGELGTGKTIIAKGIAKGLGIEEEVTSPTFLLQEIYKGRLSLYHFDLYRIDKPEELDVLGFDNFWESEGVIVIEWPEKAGDRISGSAVIVKIYRISDTERRIAVEYPDN